MPLGALKAPENWPRTHQRVRVSTVGVSILGVSSARLILFSLCSYVEAIMQ